MPRVFLSYARTDGELAAAALRDRLSRDAPDIEIRQDRLLLEGGIGWWKQLTDAIDSVEFLILLMTPAAITSGNVQKEWRYARQQGVCVYPVKAAPDAELHFARMPRWMSKSHFFDLDKEWPAFLGHLRKGCDTPRVPFMPPDLPQHFVERPAEYQALKNMLLTPDRSQPVAITTALSGAGGFGKTTLAAALCHDEDIVQNFDDGILWVTLGQTPDTMGTLLTVYAALTGQRPAFAGIDDGAFQLGQKLEERTCLLVIDDVWDAAHLRPFLRGGKSSARLFTTRDATIASEAARVTVDEMREGEATAMLGRGVQGLEAGPASELAHRLGEWPLALELASAMLRERVRQGDSATNAAGRLLKIIERKGVRALNDPANEPRHRTISNVLEASLDLLGAADRQSLIELSIFPEDVAIPLAAAASVWQLDEFDGEELAQRLARLCLLNLDLKRGLLGLHDVMRSWLASNLANSRDSHNRLLNGWPDWRNLPEWPDAYAWRWLPWHLVQAGRTQDLERILWDPRWMQAKLKATDTNALIGDYEQLKPSAERDLLQGALRLSSHVLKADPGQFGSQLAGRLLPYQGFPAIERFTAGIAAGAQAPWLRPLQPALHSPGTELVRTQRSSAGSIHCVAVAGDGKRAVSGSRGDGLVIWDLETGSPVRALEGHSGSVRKVAITGDGTRAVSASEDQTLKLWDLETGAELRTLEGHSKCVRGVALAPDGKRAVSASEDGTLKLWDLGTGAVLRTLTGHSAAVLAVVAGPDGSRAVSASADGTLKIWDLETGAALRTLMGHSNSVNDVALTPDGRRAVSASGDGRLIVWDLDTGAALHTLNGHSRSVCGVAVTPDGKRAVSAEDRGTLKLWDLESGRELRSLRASYALLGVTAAPDGRRAVCASGDGTLLLWDFEVAMAIHHPKSHGGSVSGLAVTSKGKLAVSVSWDTTLKVWDVQTGRPLRILEGHSDFVNGVAVTPDEKRVVSACGDGTLAVWDIESGAPLHWLGNHFDAVNGVAVTPDGKRAVSASEDHTLMTWDLETAAELRTIEGHDDSVNGVAVTPDGKIAISASWDGTLIVWDLETGAELRKLCGHAAAVFSVAVTPDGTRAVSASWDNTLKVWDVEKGGALRTLKGHHGSVSAVAVSPDGRRAVSASDDKTLKVWDLESGKPLAAFYCDANPRCCVFAGGHRILAGDASGWLHFLQLEEPARGGAEAVTA